MSQPYTVSFPLDMCAVDFTGRWQPGAVFRAMQEASSAHCASLHASYQELHALGLAWVLTRASLEMERYPTLGQTVTVSTWPTETRHAFFPRHYTFALDGEEIGRATALYVLLDIETRKIATPARLTVPIPVCPRPAPLPMPGNLTALEAPVRSASYTPVYTDLDMNGHVNNTRYVDWFMNQFPLEKHKREELARLLIHYHFEVRPEEPLRLELQEQGSLAAFHGISGDRPCFMLEGEWRAKP